jgi:hypothetical protein
MKELSVNKLEDLQGGKFWGSTNKQKLMSDGSYYCTSEYEVLWTTVSFDIWISSVPCSF